MKIEKMFIMSIFTAFGFNAVAMNTQLYDEKGSSSYSKKTYSEKENLTGFMMNRSQSEILLTPEKHVLPPKGFSEQELPKKSKVNRFFHKMGKVFQKKQPKILEDLQQIEGNIFSNSQSVLSDNKECLNPEISIRHLIKVINNNPDNFEAAAEFAKRADKKRSEKALNREKEYQRLMAEADKKIMEELDYMPKDSDGKIIDQNKFLRARMDAEDAIESLLNKKYRTK